MIFGLETSEPIPEETIPIEAVAIIKGMDHDGETVFYIRSTATLSGPEALGLLTMAQQAQLKYIIDDMMGES